jgi:hypothetical protein
MNRSASERTYAVQQRPLFDKKCRRKFMAELEPGNPDELCTLLNKWLTQANDSLGSLLPAGISPTEWAVRQFIAAWRKPVRQGIYAIEDSLKKAVTALQVGDVPAAIFEIECTQQTLGEVVRSELGIYQWDREEN